MRVCTSDKVVLISGAIEAIEVTNITISIKWVTIKHPIHAYTAGFVRSCSRMGWKSVCICWCRWLLYTRRQYKSISWWINMGLCCAVCLAEGACTMGKCVMKDGQLSVKAANAMYLLILIAMTVVAFVLQEWGAPSFNFYLFNVGCENVIDPAACKGENAVYRISIGLALWFLLVALGNACSPKIHTGVWGIKVVSLIAIVSGFFFIPIVGQDSYVQIARVISALFLVSQIVSFIDAAYHWNRLFIGESTTKLKLLLVICGLFVVAIVFSLALLYINYHHCTRQEVFTTITVVLVISSTMLQLNTETESSLLTSCIVSAYAVYLCWSAIASDECNPGEQTEAQMTLACFVTSISLAWTCYSAGTKDWSHAEEQLIEEQSVEDAPKQSMVVFHLIMATGAVYMSMLLTNWGTVSGHKSDAQMWVSIISQWISITVYVWTIVAPKICTSREF